MKDSYKNSFIKDVEMRLSLILLGDEHRFNPPHNIFLFKFLRLSDRSLYHSSKVWDYFISMLGSVSDYTKDLNEESVINIDDLSLKYEIEAYMAAANSIFDLSKQNNLANDFHKQQIQKSLIEGIFKLYRGGFNEQSKNIRNLSQHIGNKGFIDYARFPARIIKSDDLLKIELLNIYKDKDANIDLAEVFCNTHIIILNLIKEMRDVLLNMVNLPKVNTHLNERTKHGNALVSLGPKGFLLNSKN